MKKLYITSLAIAGLSAMTSGYAFDAYSGVMGGAMLSKENRTVTEANATSKKIEFTYPYQIGSLGGAGDIYAGIGQKFGRFYLGTELDAYYSSSKTKQSYVDPQSKQTLSSTLANDFGAGASGILGAYIAPNNMLYARLGVVESHFQGSSTKDSNITGYAGSFSKYDLGARAGLGLESMFSKHLGMRAEVDYTQYKKFSKSNTPAEASGYIKNTEFKPSNAAVMFGLDYHF